MSIKYAGDNHINKYLNREGGDEKQKTEWE